eukprot:scaffold93544_cov72-Phaeocystis_antarctica.AAC.3
MSHSRSSLSAGSAPLASAAARVAQPASAIWVPPVGGGGAPAAIGGATRAARPSLPNGLAMSTKRSNPCSRRRAGASATSPASPMPA